MKEQRRPTREERILEFNLKLHYLLSNFWFCRQAGLGSKAYNQGLALLRETAKHGLRQPFSCLDFGSEIGRLIALGCRQKKQDASFEDVSIYTTDEDFYEVIRSLALTLKPKMGQPRAAVIEHHVIGANALVRQFCGVHLEVQRNVNSLYEPRMKSKLGTTLVTQLHLVDRRVTVTKVMNILDRSRRAGTLQTSSFRAMFPLYGATFDEATGRPNLLPGSHLVEWLPVPQPQPS